MQFSGDFGVYGLGVCGLGDERAQRDGEGVTTLVALIAASPILVPADSIGTAASQRDLPIGFDGLDTVILDWIVAEGRRAICRGMPM
jgi:hypothetical protein